jgi:hypothetical protein
MIKVALLSTLLTFSFGATAANWQQEFLSPQTNELPSARGVTVDDQGFVHLQAYNRFLGNPLPNGGFFLAHQYTIRSDGQIPWIWGLSQADRMSDCGVYAKAGQRLDCKRRTGWWGEETHLEMRGTNNSNIVWEKALPGDVTVLNASIPQQDEALVLGRIDSPQPQGSRLGIYRLNAQWPPYILSLGPACAHSGETLLNLRARMPKQPGEPIRVVKACWNSFGSIDLRLEDFDPQSGVWNMRSTWQIPHNTWVTHMEIGPQGQPYVMTQDDNYNRLLLTVPPFTNQWWPMPMPIHGRVDGFFVGDRGLVIVNANPRNQQPGNPYLPGPKTEYGSPKNGPPHYDPPEYGLPEPLPLEYSISWFDNDMFWPIIQHLNQFQDLSPKAFALSNTGDVIMLGSLMYTPMANDLLFLARRDRPLQPFNVLPLQSNETEFGSRYLIGGPNNTAVVARTIARSNQSLGDPQIGIVVNQFDLPASF